MDKHRESEPRKAPSEKLSTYKKPELREFGPVGALTQGGTGIFSEGGSAFLMMFTFINRN